MQFVPLSSAAKGSAKARLADFGWSSGLAIRGRGWLPAGILAAGPTGWRGGSSGFQPGMRWATGRAGIGLAGSSADGSVDAERPWNRSG